jgi:aryl sulfotransferase
MPTPAHYRSADEDSARWLDFAFRPGDIVISTRSKTGTTWMQMICALLTLRTADLPAPLPQLSPWLDWLVVPQQEVYDHLAAQRHRRFIKTHTPLDGVPLDARVAYIVMARHPLDMAVSLYHQSDNKLGEVHGGAVAQVGDLGAAGEAVGQARPRPGAASQGGQQLLLGATATETS